LLFSGEDDMSVKSVGLAVAVAVLSASTALAQGWHEYISRDEFFLVGMPSVPQITSTTYRAASGAMLPAKQFVATEGQRRYTVTVVHYMNASAADEAAAIEHAVQSFRNRPAQVTYDREQLVEGLPAHMIYLLNPDQSRIAAGVILHPRDTGHGGPGRLYILEGYVPAGEAPAIQFPQSFFLMDENANRLDYVTNAAGKRVRNVRTQQASVSGPYGAREPATCTAADQAEGKPTAAQVAQYIKCTLEGIADGALFLIEDIQVREIGDAGQFDASFFPDIDTRQPVYPIRGSLLRYNCDREGRNVAWGRAEPGANCVTFLEANASGHCYKTTAGVWSCSMSDLVARKTEKVAPPK
jgi:hypothetical protein